ncbi:MAG: ABC transporter substrate-binding protein [Chthoniobacterales bacterium]
MRLTKALILYIPALIGLGLLTGCDNNPHTPALRKKRADGSPWIVTYRAFPQDPRSLDPQFAYDEISHAVLSNIYDTFLTYDPLSEEYHLIPMIGAELPKYEPQPDGTVAVTCKIKPGLYFHDDACFPGGKGREITSRDFIYAFQRMSDPKVECPIASTLQDYLIGFEDAYNNAEKAGVFNYDAPFKPVEAVDRYTFRINLKKAYPQIKYWLAFWFTAPVAREAVEYYNGKIIDGIRHPLFRFHPVGTGAFSLHDWKRGELIRLVRNDNYHTLRFPAGGWNVDVNSYLAPLANSQLPTLDEVQLIIIPESIPAWILFKQGWTDSSGVGKDIFNSVITASQELTLEFEKRGVQLIKDLDLDTWYLMFNMKDPVLGGNVKLRQAMVLAFNADTYNEIFGNNILHMTDQLLPPRMFGYEASFKNPWRETNLEKARKLIAEAGYPNGVDPKTGKPLEIVLDTEAGSSTERQSAEYDRSQFEALGIRVRIEENLFTQMLEKQMKGRYQLVSAGWSADYPDPENFFALFYGPNIVPVGHNQSMYQNAEFDHLFEKMATMEDTPERADIIRRMNKILLTDDCVIGPIFNRVSYRLRQPWTPYFIKNAIVGQFGGLRYGVIDTALRKEKQAEWNRKKYWPLLTMIIIFGIVLGYGIHKRRQANV